MEENMETTEKKNQKVPKTIGKRYVVKVNNEVVFATESLKEARGYIATLALTEAVTGVSIVKETVTETVLSNFEPKVQTVLVASQLDQEIA